MSIPASALPLTVSDLELINFARVTIDSTTNAGVGQDGIHTLGAAVRAADGRVFAGVGIQHFTGGPGACQDLLPLAFDHRAEQV
ncbi:hypothetical protein [Glutamicibacter sp. BW77]|uniref:hypothetical protein n=1 Tax=Glutamicibacter TaxID=1742989 RepID=UPI001144CFA1|nr:hypothetical protein [Glutamicibacter sp. BW77]